MSDTGSGAMASMARLTGTWRIATAFSGKMTQEETNIISLHLGNGCSAAAIRGGKSIDTSMGMTPLEGLMMGTRSGDIDPALVALIAERERISNQEVEKLLNNESGLLGVSGVSGDMRQLSQRGDDPNVRLALEMFCYRVRKYVGCLSCGHGRRGCGRIHGRHWREFA